MGLIKIKDALSTFKISRRLSVHVDGGLYICISAVARADSFSFRLESEGGCAQVSAVEVNRARGIYFMKTARGRRGSSRRIR